MKLFIVTDGIIWEAACECGWKITIDSTDDLDQDWYRCQQFAYDHETTEHLGEDNAVKTNYTPSFWSTRSSKVDTTFI